MLNNRLFLNHILLLACSLSFLYTTIFIPLVTAAPGPPSLLFYSGNIQSETEPCG